MIIVYGGPTAGLAPAVATELTGRLRGLINSLAPGHLVGGLATDADRLFASLALSEGRPVRAVLPAVRDDFRRAMIAASGPAWAADFDRIAGNDQVTVVERDDPAPDGAKILDEAGVLAKGSGDSVWLIAIRPDPRTAPDPAVEDLVRRADERQILTLDLAPVRPGMRAFVVMPYGMKRDGPSGIEINCDPPFHKVYRPLLEDADLAWTRSDLETDTGIIHPGMLSEVANCDIAIADLTTTNFNVGYELGARHVFAPRATMLVHPQITEIGARTPPFDVTMSRLQHFDRGLVLTDVQAEAAIRSLRPVLEQAIADTALDSPAHIWFDMLAPERPLRLREGVREYEERLKAARDRIRDAEQSSDRELMIAAAGWLVDAADLPEAVRRVLRIQLASAMLGEEAYQEAHDLLAIAEPPVGDSLHRTWLQRSVMAHRRLGEQAADPQRRMAELGKAQRLLSAAVDAGYRDSETYGIWGGLIKREIHFAGQPLAHPATRSRFREMARKYRAGFELDPDYYTGINLVMALRLGTRDGRFAADFNETVVATRVLTRSALKRDPADYWALFTMAELALHEALERGGHDLSEATDLYLEAALRAGRDQVASAQFQLRFLRSYGDHPDAISSLLAAVADVRGQPGSG